jgi:hypothetical protein
VPPAEPPTRSNAVLNWKGVRYPLPTPRKIRETMNATTITVAMTTSVLLVLLIPNQLLGPGRFD